MTSKAKPADARDLIGQVEVSKAFMDEEERRGSSSSRRCTLRYMRRS
tara:strand:- start:47 stop:187 length:141 start_codon:yes stop_codon:yes gene_type:complete